MFKKRQLSETAADISGTDALAAMCIPADAAEARALSAHPSSYRLSSFPPCPTPLSLSPPTAPRPAPTNAATTVVPHAAEAFAAVPPSSAPAPFALTSLLLSPSASETRIVSSAPSFVLHAPAAATAADNPRPSSQPTAGSGYGATSCRSPPSRFTVCSGFYPETVLGGHTAGVNGNGGATPFISAQLQRQVSNYDCRHNDSPFGQDEPIREGLGTLLRKSCSGGRVAACAVLLCVVLVIAIGGLLMVA